LKENIPVHSVTGTAGRSGFSTAEKEKWKDGEEAPRSKTPPRGVHFDTSVEEIYSSTPREPNQAEFNGEQNVNLSKEDKEITLEEISALKDLLKKFAGIKIIKSGRKTGSEDLVRKLSMPASAYLSNRLSEEPPDGDDGSSSSSDSEDSDDEDKKNIRETTPLPDGREETPATRATRKRVQKLKLPEPFVYDGSPDYDQFEQWCYEVDNWMDLSGVDEYYALKYLATYLSGKAATFYMTHVATSVSQYTVERLYRDLFEYCFPINFKRKLRDRFFRLTQGTRNVRDFLRELQRLGSRLADVTDKDIAQRFWKGVHGYIRIELAKKGKDSENTSLKKLAKRAIRYENAENLRIEELHEAQQGPRIPWRRGYSGYRGTYQSSFPVQQRISTPANLLTMKLATNQPKSTTPMSILRNTDNGRSRGRGRGRGGSFGNINRRVHLSKMRKMS